MKETLKIIIIWIITFEAKLILLRYRPKIIAVTGSVGKTSTKDAIFAGLSKKVHIRKNHKSLNSEIGVPLTIIGSESGWNNPLKWFKIILLGIIRAIYVSKYPKWLVLEVGIDRPGDMKKTAKWLKPDVAVFTTFSKVPVHVEFFDDVENVWEEKSKLMDYVKKDGVVVLNADDEPVLKLKNNAKVKVLTYSAKNWDDSYENKEDSEDSKLNQPDVFASNYGFLYKNENLDGITFKINYHGNVLPISLQGVLGEQHIYPSVIAVATAVMMKINPVDIIPGLSEQNFAPGRMRLLKGEEGSMLIDDTYNASPIAVKRALQTLASIENKGKKVAVLGDMLELGRYSHSEHQKVGRLCTELKIDSLICVGVRSEAIADSAVEAGMNSENVIKVSKSKKAIPVAHLMLGEGNVFLIKGSQGMRMERITYDLMLGKDNAENILVRQEKEWERR